MGSCAVDTRPAAARPLLQAEPARTQKTRSVGRLMM